MSKKVFSLDEILGKSNSKESNLYIAWTRAMSHNMIYFYHICSKFLKVFQT